MVLKGPLISHTGEGCAHLFKSPGRDSSVNQQIILYTFFQVSWETDLFESVELYLKDGLEQAVH